MRKRFVLLCLVFFMLFDVLFVSYTPAVQAKRNDIGQVTGSDVNMRSGPDISAEMITKLPIGTVFEVLDEVENNGEIWYRVVYDDRTGFIRKDKVLIRSISDRIGYVISDGANLRGGPSQSAYVITKMSGGHVIRIRQLVGAWYYVSYDGQEGFVRSDLVDLTTQTGTGYDVLLRFGMSGLAVKELQNALVKRNFISEKSVDGDYGNGTRTAVKEFQKLAGIEPADGVAGPATLEVLYDPNNTIKKPPVVPSKPEDFYGRVQTIDWWKGGNKVLRRPGGTAKVYDIYSGASFMIRRTGGTNHIDGAPITASDTAIFKKMLGGHWSHDKRPILLIVGTRVYAASIYCMPHGTQVIKNNNYPGMLCIHFVNSRTHGGNRVDPSHKSNIQYAYNKYK